MTHPNTQADTLRRAADYIDPMGHTFHLDDAATLAASLRAMADEAGQHESPRWHRIDELREMARQFTCHPVSRGISDCEEAGDLMSDAAAEIERLCRVRNCLAGSNRTRTARLQQLERQRDYLLAEMRRIDSDTGNAGHYASEAIAAICAEEGATAAVRDFSEESAQSLRDLRSAALLALGLLWMTERQSDKVHRAYTTLRDALGGKEALREGIQAAMDAGNEADHPHGADWWAGKKEASAGVTATFHLRSHGDVSREELERIAGVKGGE